MRELYLKMSCSDAIMLASEQGLFIPNLKEAKDLHLPYVFWTCSCESINVFYNSLGEKVDSSELLNVVFITK